MKHNLITRYLDDGNNNGGGGNAQPTLDDLTNPNYVPPAGEQNNDLDAATQKAAADKLVAEQAEAAEYGELVKAAKNDDGSLKEGYLEIDGKITKDPNHQPTADDTDDDPEEFFKDVDKLHGQELKIEYPDGVDPFTPEGVHFRDKTMMEIGAENFEAYLKKADPQSYAYMLHRQAGGDDSTFFTNKTFSLPEYDTFKDNQDLQVKLYKSSLVLKGLDEDTAQLAVDKAIKDGVLFTKADEAYKATEKSHADNLKAIEAQQTAAEKEYLSSINTLDQKLTTAISEGKGMKFIIPDTEKALFTKFVKEHLEYDNPSKKFLIVQKVEDSLEKQLEAMYLLYKKGDLTGLIQRSAETKIVSRFKRTVDKSKSQQASSSATPTNKGFIALGDL